MPLRMRSVARVAWPIAMAALWAIAPQYAVRAQSTTSAARPASQPNDEEYTKKIKEYLQDPRITTELVDHLPASSTVPTPLKFLGRIVGTPGELTYAKDMYRYFDALDAASDRIKVWRIGKTEEGRDIIVAAIGDEATIKDLDKYKGYLNALTDPRKTTEEQARQIIGTPSRSTGSSAACTRRRPAGPRCSWRWRTASSSRRRRYPEHPEQRDHVHHAGDRGGRTREAGRHVLLQQEAPAGRAEAAAHVLGQIRRARQQPRRHGAVPRPDADRHSHAERVDAHDHARPARGADVPLCVDRHGTVQRGAPIPSPWTSGGTSRTTTSWR